MNEHLDKFKQLQDQRQQSKFLGATDTTSGGIDLAKQSLAQKEAMMGAMDRQQASSTIDFNPLAMSNNQLPIFNTGQTQESVLPGRVRVTQAFGNYNPGIEVFSKSGRNYGVDFGVKEGTPIALPPGTWQVMEAYDRARGRGHIGNVENRGYGNSILVQNTQTGEVMRFSHLSGVNVAPGRTYTGGTVIGASGATGNVTGPHLDLEYKTPDGQFRDVLKSPYAKYIFGAIDKG